MKFPRFSRLNVKADFNVTHHIWLVLKTELTVIVWKTKDLSALLLLICAAAFFMYSLAEQPCFLWLFSVCGTETIGLQLCPLPTHVHTPSICQCKHTNTALTNIRWPFAFSEPPLHTHTHTQSDIYKHKWAHAHPHTIGKAVKWDRALIIPDMFDYRALTDFMAVLLSRDKEQLGCWWQEPGCKCTLWWWS